MKLQMYLDGKLVDSAFVAAENMERVQVLKQMMEDRNSDIIDLSGLEPQFFLEGISSRMNEDSKKIEEKFTWN